MVINECCCKGRDHEGPCCPGWDHFNDLKLPDGRILSDIECCIECGTIANDDAALEVHDATCMLCVPATLEDSDLIVPTNSPEVTPYRIPFVRIRKRRVSVKTRIEISNEFGKHAPRSVCACSHTGDGANSEHTDTIQSGHGHCRVCPPGTCSRFSWAGYTEMMRAALRKGT